MIKNADSVITKISYILSKLDEFNYILKTSRREYSDEFSPGVNKVLIRGGSVCFGVETSTIYEYDKSPDYTVCALRFKWIQFESILRVYDCIWGIGGNIDDQSTFFEMIKFLCDNFKLSDHKKNEILDDVRTKYISGKFNDFAHGNLYSNYLFSFDYNDVNVIISCSVEIPLNFNKEGGVCINTLLSFDITFKFNKSQNLLSFEIPKSPNASSKKSLHSNGGAKYGGKRNKSVTKAKSTTGRKLTKPRKK
jgi:hypothetical protein